MSGEGGGGMSRLGIDFINYFREWHFNPYLQNMWIIKCKILAMIIISLAQYQPSTISYSAITLLCFTHWTTRFYGIQCTSFPTWYNMPSFKSQIIINEPCTLVGQIWMQSTKVWNTRWILKWRKAPMTWLRDLWPGNLYILISGFFRLLLWYYCQFPFEYWPILIE